MKKANLELREKLKAANIPLWVVAKQIGVHEKTLVCWLRFDLAEFGDRNARVMTAVEKIMQEEAANDPDN